ncbi:MAG: DUF4364 family protein [Ruminococcaceae bacterium]|nr:DUF4364 family protein [Oscillospiraceae bacterium]
MSYDAFDEGISLGGMRTKNEIRTLICYMFTAVGKPMSKELVVNALLKKGLTNYFEASSCFDDLISNGNLKLDENSDKLYVPTVNGKIISEQLEDTLPLTAKERAFECALLLLEKERIERENKVTTEKADNGYYVTCEVSGGDMDLMKLKMYMPDSNQAKSVKRNFYKNPQLVYEIMVATITRNKELIRQALEDLDNMA